MLDQTKLNQYAKLLEEQQISRLHQTDLACPTNLANSKVSIKAGKKYTNVDLGNSGKYMVVNDTGEIFGIKAYGVIHRGHAYGTLETTSEWFWGSYKPVKK